MRKFRGNRKLDALIETAITKGFEVDQEDFDKGGDWIWFRDKDKRRIYVVFNTFTGYFYVYNPLSMDRPVASHKSSHLDDAPWYIEILEMFYEPLDGDEK